MGGERGVLLEEMSLQELLEGRDGCTHSESVAKRGRVGSWCNSITSGAMLGRLWLIEDQMCHSILNHLQMLGLDQKLASTA